MAKSTYTCIICPISCKISVNQKENGELEISGNKCNRGIEYAKNEFTCPQRMLTTTVKINGSKFKRLPVISSREVPKAQMRNYLEEIYTIEISAPVKEGDIIIKNIFDTNIDILAARSMGEYHEKNFDE